MSFGSLRVIKLLFQSRHAVRGRHNAVCEFAPPAERLTVEGQVYTRMPSCQNCESFVTEQYVRVFTPEQFDRPRVCPNCEDKLREGAEIRKARSTRS